MILDRFGNPFPVHTPLVLRRTRAPLGFLEREPLAADEDTPGHYLQTAQANLIHYGSLSGRWIGSDSGYHQEPYE